MTSFHKLFAVALFLGSVADASAQAPANDRCSTAQTIIPNSGAVAGTTSNANDDLIGLWGCQNQAGTSNIHPDVWFTFTATNSVMGYSIAPAGNNPAAPFEVFVYQGSCSGALVQLNSVCGRGFVRDGFGGLVAGQSYLIAVASSSPQTAGAFTIDVTNTAPVNTPSQDCNMATVLATGATFSQGRVNTGSGSNTTEVSPQNSCWGFGGERQSKWFKFIAGSTGVLQFTINPNNPQDDYDWAVWDITGDPTGCTTKGSALACNWAPAFGATGLSLCPTLEPGYNDLSLYDNKTTGLTGADAPITVQAGRVYALLVDNYSTSNQGFTLSLGGACNPPPRPTAQIGISGIEQFSFANSGCSDVQFYSDTVRTSTLPLTYTWFFGDGSSSTQRSPIHTYAGSPSGPTQYPVTLRLQDVLGQTLEQTQIVTVPPAAAADIVVNQPTDICAGTAVTLRARGGAAYNWTPVAGITNPTDSVITVRPDTTTQYTLTAIRGNCTATNMITINVTQPQDVSGTIMQPSGVAPHTTGFTPTATDGTAWLWDFGDGTNSANQNPNHTYVKPGKYSVKLQMTYGIANCQTELREIGTVEVFEPVAYNIITPDGDGKNDKFIAKVSPLKLSLKVFNRWGWQVYEVKDYQQDWNGGDLPAATYYYLLEDTAGKSWKGWIQITR